jgi:hypothetical protein
MMTSWSIDSGDAFNTVDAVSVSGACSSKQPPAPASTDPAAAAATAARKKEQAPAVSDATPSAEQKAHSALPQHYQIEHFTEINSDDRAFFGISAPRGRSDRSHRTVRFRFGVVNNHSNHSGSGDSRPPSRSVGEDEEHELVLSWSVRTGKRIISYDRIILYSITLKGFGVCDHTVLTPDGKFSLRVLSCTEPPLGAAPNFETSELLIDGVSYYDLPRMGRSGTLEMPPPVRADRGRLVNSKSGRKVIYTVGEALCPDAVERSRQESGFEDEEG